MSDDSKSIMSFRVRPETSVRLQAVVQMQGLRPNSKGEAAIKPTMSLYVADLLDAVAERRVVVLAEPLHHVVNDGSDVNCPVLVSGGQDAS